jgi:proliferating cell nuclear antigen PCNA
MKLVINNPSKANKFSNIFNNLKYFTDAMNIYFSENGLYVQGMDRTHCCLFELNINPIWFDFYEFNASEDNGKIGFSTGIMQKVLSTRSENQSIIINYSGSPDKLSFHFLVPSDNKKLGFDKHIDIPLMDIDDALLTIPKTDYDAEFVIYSTTMREIVEELSIFNDKLEIELNEEKINFKSSGIEGEMGITINNEDIVEYAIIENGNLKKLYSLKFFKLMSGFNKLSTYVKLGFSETCPMMMVYSLEEDTNNYIKFHLAPYIDD